MTDHKAIAKRLRDLADEIENLDAGCGQSSTQGGGPITRPAGTTQPGAQNPGKGNPYADTPDKVRIQTDINLYLEESATAPFLQSRFIRQLWDIAESMNVQLEIANACLLSGVPANNTAHFDDCRTVDIRYLRTDAENIGLIHRILAAFPVYHPETQYVKWATDDSEVRVSPEIRDRLKLPWIKRIQADPNGNHDNHIHVRFGE